MPLHGIDHVQLFVGNALQSAFFYTHAMGFKEVAYAGLETGVRDRTSHVLQQGRIRLVLTGALTPGHEIGHHHTAHGDGVHDIALSVPDVDHAYREATARGAKGVREPWEESDEHGVIHFATIATYGETLHTFVDRSHYSGAFRPGSQAARRPARGRGGRAGLHGQRRPRPLRVGDARVRRALVRGPDGRRRGTRGGRAPS